MIFRRNVRLHNSLSALSRSVRKSRLYPCLLAASFFLQPSFPLYSAAADALEYDVKAAFLLNFTKFISWPPTAFATADAPFLICILGDDPFGRSIDQVIEGESVQGHRIAVARLRPDDHKSCQLLYISDKRMPSTPLADAGPGVLTVGEGDDFIHQGGIVAFVVDHHHVRFDINLKAADNAGLKLSSKLLSVARLVEK